MVEIICRTNLDISNHEQWPSRTEAVPRVGESIQSSKKWLTSYRLTLKVVAVTWQWVTRRDCSEEAWLPVIELHTKHNMSVTEFTKMYEQATGRMPV